MKKLLKKYSEKRDFSLTKEPSGEEKKSRKISTKKKKGPIFVVQEHHASHLHYDFRLELDGVLKSWAIPKGPSMNPGDKRLAVLVEDHPLEYATFHGTIPKGQYGAGEVYIWDNGTWEIIGDTDAHNDLKNGTLKFKLYGKKLKGEFVLVRMSARGKNKNAWLLIKHFDETSAEKKTAKKEYKKVKKWPGFIHPQLCLLVDSPPKEANYVHEIKFDGYRVQPQIKDGKIKIFTRNGVDWSQKFPTLLKALSSLEVENAILDGEAIVQDKEGRSNLGLLQAALSDEDDRNVKLFLFDCMFLNGEDLRDLPLKMRKEKLKSIIPKRHRIIRYSEDVDQDGESFFQMACRHNLEGIISKDATAPYSKGRGRVWCKTKCSQRQELVIGGYTTGKGSRSAELGALLLGIYDKKKFRYVGKVGTGFSRQSLKELKEKVKKFEQARSAFDLNSPKGKEIHWLKPKLVAEVSFSEWTQEKVLRHPVFVGLCEDKSQGEDSTRLSHPEKIIFAKEKITKLQVADYYDTIAGTMLPFLTDRPLALVRCPQGASGKCFFHKHPGPEQAPTAYFTRFNVLEKSGTNTYLALNSKEGLNHLVQMNAFEIHVWNCHYQTLMNPDQIVMDFDPGLDVPFKEVVKAALGMKKMFVKLKLKSFVKTTGGKGLHIHIPIEPIYSWDQVKAFAKAIADEMVSRNPKLFLAKTGKKERKGKIFLDYLRNNFGATVIAPYSLRAREISSVAMPVEWTELTTLKSSDQFTLKKAMIRIKKRKRDPWKNFFKVRQKIKILEQKLAA